MVRTPEIDTSIDINKFPVRCFKCKKAPKNCTCAQYRIEGDTLYADNVATDPAPGERVGLWQARRNARIWRRPQFIDGFALMRVTDPSVLEEVSLAVERGTFFIDNYRDREGVYIPAFDKSLVKRLPIFHKRRAKKKDI